MGTSFLRFLELADALKLSVAVVTDNDGDVAGLEKKYADYIKENKKDKITICYDQVEDTGTLKIGEKPYNYNTLEPKILKANGNNITLCNSSLGTDYSTIEMCIRDRYIPCTFTVKSNPLLSCVGRFKKIP